MPVSSLKGIQVLYKRVSQRCEVCIERGGTHSETFFVISKKKWFYNVNWLCMTLRVNWIFKPFCFVSNILMMVAIIQHPDQEKCQSCKRVLLKISGSNPLQHSRYVDWYVQRHSSAPHWDIASRLHKLSFRSFPMHYYVSVSSWGA
jgi:hypothetical protein